MATRHFLHRGMAIVKPGSFWSLGRSSMMQKQVTMATSQQPFNFEAKILRYPQATNQCAGFHSSRRLLDENHVIIQDEDDFKEKVINSDSVIIVDFHAEWCNPCKALAPVLDAALSATQGQVKLAKVDIDELQDLAINYGVNSVPTVMAFKGGVKVDKFIGLQSQDKVEAFLEKQLR